MESITPVRGSLWCFCFSFSQKVHAPNGEQAFSSHCSPVLKPTSDRNDLNSAYYETACVFVIIITKMIHLIPESFTCQW